MLDSTLIDACRPTAGAERDAMRLAAARLDAAETRHEPSEMSRALLEVGRCYRRLQLFSCAESSLQQALRWGRLAGSTDLVVELLCELCESAALLADARDAAQRGQGHVARERARDHAFEASTLAGRVADTGWEVQVLLRISDVLARCGDRDDALLLQSRALQLLSGSAARVLNPSKVSGPSHLADA